MGTGLGRRKAASWLLVCVFSWVSVVAPAAETVRSRDRGHCGVLVTSSPKDDTNGVPVAPLDLGAFQKFLETSPKVEGVVVLTGVPMTTGKRRAFEQGARQLLDDHGLGDTPLLVVTEPDQQASWWRRSWQRLVYFFPRKSDWQPPQWQEVAQGFGIAAGANASIAIFTFASFPAAIAIPIVATNSGLDFVIGTLRRFTNNWVNRSEGAPVEKFLKNCSIGTMFVAGVYTAERSAKIIEACANSTLGELAQAAGRGALEFAQSQAPTILANGFLFTLLFNGLYEWTRRKEATPEGNEQSRKYFGWIMGTMFTVTGPLYLGAITSKQVALDFGAFTLNPFQVALAALALAGTYLWKYPQKFDYAIPIVDYVSMPVVRAFTYPFRAVAKAVRWGYRTLLGLDDAPKPAP